MRITLAILALSFICFAFYPQPTAQAAAGYDAQCKAAGGTSLVWDGVGLRWCCIKRIGLSNARVHKSTLWCKS
jgi:hypothetical protein